MTARQHNRETGSFGLGYRTAHTALSVVCIASSETLLLLNWTFHVSRRGLLVYSLYVVFTRFGYSCPRVSDVAANRTRDCLTERTP